MRFRCNLQQLFLFFVIGHIFCFIIWIIRNIRYRRVNIEAPPFPLPSNLRKLTATNNWAQLPWIFVITPTFYRLTQKADLTRLAQTLWWIPKLHWIVVEDGKRRSIVVRELLNRTKLNYTHLNAVTDPEIEGFTTFGRESLGRGMSQRNRGLQWMRANYRNTTVSGVLYFADDDNTYDIRLFTYIRAVQRIGIWAVGLVGGSKVERPIVYKDRVIGWDVGHAPERDFATDMAGFAINLKLILSNNAEFNADCDRGYFESCFLLNFSLDLDMLEPFGLSDEFRREILVWHTKTQHSGEKGSAKGFEI